MCCLPYLKIIQLISFFRIWLYPIASHSGIAISLQQILISHLLQAHHVSTSSGSLSHFCSIRNLQLFSAVLTIIQNAFSHLLCSCFPCTFYRPSLRYRPAEPLIASCSIDSTMLKVANSVALEPEISSPHSQQPLTSPYPEPVIICTHLQMA